MYTINKIADHNILTLKKDAEHGSIGQAQELKENLDRIIGNQNIKSIIIDLKNINYLNSSAIGALMSCQKTAYSKNVHFALMGLNSQLLEIFDFASIKDLFTIYKNERELP